MELKPFSESINSGINNSTRYYQNSEPQYSPRGLVMEKIPKDKKSVEYIFNLIKNSTPELVEDAGQPAARTVLEHVEKTGKPYFEIGKGNTKTKHFIPKEIFRKAQHVLADELQNWTMPHLETVKATPEYTDFRKSLEKRIFENKKLLAVPYPDAVAAKTAAKTLAEKATKEAAQKIGIVASGKTLAKFVLKATPWIVGGMVIADVINRISKLMKNESVEKVDQKSESNVIPLGNFYHKDVGWY